MLTNFKTASFAGWVTNFNNASFKELDLIIYEWRSEKSIEMSGFSISCKMQKNCKLFLLYLSICAVLKIILKDNFLNDFENLWCSEKSIEMSEN